MRGILGLVVMVALTGCGPSAERIAARDAGLARCRAEIPLTVGNYARRTSCMADVASWFDPRHPANPYLTGVKLGLAQAVDAKQMSPADAQLALSRAIHEVQQERAQADALAAQAALGALAVGLAGAAAASQPAYVQPYAMPVPRTTNCMRMGNMLNCTSY